MRVLFANEADVHALLPMERCVALMRTALVAHARGDALLPLRMVLRPPGVPGVLAVMPGWLGEPAGLGLKVVSVMPGNLGSGFDSHQGVVMLFGAVHGEPLAILDATAITSIRTAAASAVATDALARPDAGDLAILGSGAQARTHLEAMRAVRTVRRVRLWSRTRERAESFARAHAAAAGIAIEVCAGAEDAVRGADLVCTTTASREPVLRGDWVAPGAHVNAVGACFPTHREIDTGLVLRSRFFTDNRESCTHEAGDWLLARAEGAIPETHLLGELGDVLAGGIEGRRSHDDVTVYESLGIAIEDLASAHEIHARALAMGAGTWLEWGGPPSA